jgi:hypothetical protein
MVQVQVQVQYLEGIPGNACQGNADSRKLFGRHLVTEEGNAASQHDDELEVANHIECEAGRCADHQKCRPRHQQPQDLQSQIESSFHLCVLPYEPAPLW